MNNKEIICHTENIISSWVAGILYHLNHSSELSAWDKYWNILNKRWVIGKSKFNVTQDKKFVAYTQSKGVYNTICIANTQRILNRREILIVITHELAHMACPEIGHTKLFWELYQLLIYTTHQIYPFDFTFKYNSEISSVTMLYNLIYDGARRVYDNNPNNHIIAKQYLTLLDKTNIK